MRPSIFSFSSFGIAALALLAAAPVSAQVGPLGTAPQIAFDIPRADIATIFQNSPPHGLLDRPMRIIDMGKYNLELAVVRREPGKDDMPGPDRGTYHSKVGEVYVMLSGSGVLTTGGTMTDSLPYTVYNLTAGPSVNGNAGKGAYSRTLHVGDIVVIPAGTFHAWSKITETVTYLSMRLDPDRVLPAGFVSPLLLKNATGGPLH